MSNRCTHQIGSLISTHLVLVGLLAALVLAFGSVPGASAVNAQIVVGSATVQAQGQQAPIAVSANGITNMGAFTIDISYDPAIADAVSCTPASGFFCNAQYENNNVNPDKVRCGGFDANGRSGNVSLCTITFQAVGGAACTALNPTVHELVDTGSPAQPIPSDVTAGQFCLASDADGDGVADGQDNCPRWPNPTQGLPPWPVPVGDSDCDGFTDSREVTMGTDRFAHCPTSTTHDAWPPDLIVNGTINILDVLAFKSPFGQGVPPASPRYDIESNNVINVTDVLALKAYFGKSCA